jgi:putative membrane protein
MMMHVWGLHEWGTVAWPLLALWIGLRLVFWALLLTAMVLGVRWLRHRTAAHAPTPLDTLKLRYARGELSKQEFDAIRRDLE